MRLPGDAAATGGQSGHMAVYCNAPAAGRWMVSCGITVGAGATGLVGLLTCAGSARKQTRPAP